MKTTTCLLAAAVTAALFMPPSRAAVPGENGLIAFTTRRFSDSKDICVMNPQGAHRVAVVEHPADERDVAWSPDGTRLAFASDRAGNYDIYVLEVATNELQRLTTNPARDANPDWSPDGTEIAYTSSGGERQGLYVMNSDGSGERRLTDDAGDTNPSWSPDGNSIGFSNDDRDGQPDDGGTWAFPREGGSPTRIGGGHDFDWSPRGDEIVTTNLFSGGVSVRDVETGQQRSIAGFRPTHSPSWSPNGEEVVFGGLRYRPEGVSTGGLFATALDGSGTRRLIRESEILWSIDWQRRPPGGNELSEDFLPCRRIIHERSVSLRVDGRVFRGRVRVLDGYPPCQRFVRDIQLERETPEGWDFVRWIESDDSGRFERRRTKPGRYRVVLGGRGARRPSGRVDACAGDATKPFTMPGP